MECHIILSFWNNLWEIQYKKNCRCWYICCTTMCEIYEIVNICGFSLDSALHLWLLILTNIKCWVLVEDEEKMWEYRLVYRWNNGWIYEFLRLGWGRGRLWWIADRWLGIRCQYEGGGGIFGWVTAVCREQGAYSCCGVWMDWGRVRGEIEYIVWGEGGNRRRCCVGELRSRSRPAWPLRFRQVEVEWW